MALEVAYNNAFWISLEIVSKGWISNICNCHINCLIKSSVIHVKAKLYDNIMQTLSELHTTIAPFIIIILPINGNTYMPHENIVFLYYAFRICRI